MDPHLRACLYLLHSYRYIVFAIGAGIISPAIEAACVSCCLSFLGDSAAFSSGVCGLPLLYYYQQAGDASSQRAVDVRYQLMLLLQTVPLLCSLCC